MAWFGKFGSSATVSWLMLDQSLRRRLQSPLDQLARELVRLGVNPNATTAVGFALGVGAVVATTQSMWLTALVLWLANRAIDGIDGPIARASKRGPSELGGFLDLMADFTIYGALIAALGYAEPDARVAALVVLVAYYLNGAALLAWSGLPRNLKAKGDGRTLLLSGGLAEGTETIVAGALFLLFPGIVEQLLWIWAGLVFVTVGQRLFFTVQTLAVETAQPDRETSQH